MLYYQAGNITTQVSRWKFPDGCVGVNINTEDVFDYVPMVKVSIRFGDDEFTINDSIMSLAFAMDALKYAFPQASFILDMPYIPYARQDRACSPGEAAQLKVVGRMINDMGFSEVHSVDAHSTVAANVFDRLYDRDQFSVFGKIHPSFREIYIVAPDAGAAKKCEAFAKRVGAAGVITCAKQRDPSNGKILGMKVLDSVPDNANLLVLDDLCDGGATFKGVSACLEKYNPETIELAVTHGLFTKGVDELAKFFDAIYTTDSYLSDRDNAIVRTIKL